MPISVIRGSRNCNVLTVTAGGIPGPEKVFLTLGWRYTGTQYRGTGGSDPTVWRMTLDTKDLKPSRRLPVKAFNLSVTFYANDLSWLRNEFMQVPACTAPRT